MSQEDGVPSFTSTAFPAAEDMKVWHSLTPAEQQAVIDAAVQEGLTGSAAKRRSKDGIIAAVMVRYAADAG